MTTAVIRTRPSRLLAALLALGALAFLAIAYETNTADAAKGGPIFTNPTQITNQWLPLSSISQAVFEGTKEGAFVRSVKTRLSGTKPFTVNGQTVQAVRVEDRVTNDGVLHEVALDYYAQADDGTVHYLGEDVDNYDPTGTTVINHDGAFLYGVDTKTLGVAMPANPQPGNKFTFEKVPSQGAENNRVVSLTANATNVPYCAGTCPNSLEIAGFLSPGGERETKWYRSGVGLVKEADITGEVALVSIS